MWRERRRDRHPSIMFCICHCLSGPVHSGHNHLSLKLCADPWLTLSIPQISACFPWPMRASDVHYLHRPIAGAFPKETSSEPVEFLDYPFFQCTEFSSFSRPASLRSFAFQTGSLSANLSMSGKYVRSRQPSDSYTERLNLTLTTP